MQPITETPSSVSSQPQHSVRRYDLDWLRIIAIITLLFYHTGMIYVSWGWHIKSPVTSPLFETVMSWMHRWRMPLLFFISGAGTYFALKRRSFGSYAGERVKRLFVPLVFGIFVIVPPQIYYEWLFRGRFAGSYADFYPNVFHFQPYQDGGKGGAFSWHHLWFVLYLFVYSLMSIPLFNYLQSAAGQRQLNRLERLVARPGGALWLVVPILVSQFILKPYFPEETHALVNDWAYFVKNLLLFWLGYLLTSRSSIAAILADQRRLLLYATLICTVIYYGMRAYYFRHPELDGDQWNLWFEVPFLTNADCLMWFSVLMSVAYSYRYLNVNRPSLPYLNEAVYPFYILHQTVIVVIGYYVLQTGLGLYTGFLTVSFSTLLVCVAIYLLLIRPFGVTRLLFGMKAKRE